MPPPGYGQHRSATYPKKRGAEHAAARRRASPGADAGASNEEALASTSWAWEEGDGLMFSVVLDLAKRQVDRTEFGPRTGAYLVRMVENGDTQEGG